MDQSQFLRRVVDELLVYMEETTVDSMVDSPQSPSSPTSPVCEFKHPEKLAKILKTASLHLEAEPASYETVFENVKTMLEQSVATGHRHCLNQLFHRADAISILGDWITSAINTSIYTFETAPVVTLLEQEVAQRYRELVGWEEAFGTFPPGGSTSNLYAVICARTKRFPHVPQMGWRADDKPVVFVSEQAHYSTQKSCGMIGVGYENCVKVACDNMGRMEPTALQAAIQASLDAGKHPFCVVSTCGTTLTGAVDPIAELADVVAKFPGVWLHVDGALGGALIHSPKLRGALAGIERADSFTMNPHKMLGVTQQCSLFLCKHPTIQRDAFSTNAAYLFNDDKEYDAGKYDVGDLVFQCGRRPDAVKLWVTWRIRGDVGMARYVENAVERHLLFNQVLTSEKFNQDYAMVLPAASPVPCTCFWWVPPPARGTDLSARTIAETHCETMNAIIPRAKLRLMERGQALLTMSKLGDLPNFWRIVTNGGVSWTLEQAEDFVGAVRDTCDEIYAELEAKGQLPTATAAPAAKSATKSA